MAANSTTFSPGVTMQADTQSYQAGNGSGGAGSLAVVNFNNATFQNTASTATPLAFTFEQDANITDAEIPASAQFFGGTPPTTYTIQSLEGNLTLSTGGKVAGSALTLSAAGTTIIGDNLDLSSLTASGASIQLNGTGGSEAITTTATAGQTYNSPVVLGANTTLSDSGGGNIVFNSTVDGAHALEVDTAGNEIFDGVVGGTTALTSLTTDGSGTVGGQAQFNMNLTTVPFNVAGVNAGTVTINDAVLFNAVDSILAGPTVRTTVGGQTYNGAATLGADTILADSAGKNITFNSTVDGAHNLTVDTQGDEIFNGVVGGTTALTSLTTDNPGAPETATAGGQAEFNMNLTTVPFNVAGVNAGTVTINDAVLFNAVDSILAGPTVRTTVGGQTYNGAATLGADTILADSAGKNITFNSTVSEAAGHNNNLTIDAAVNLNGGSVNTGTGDQDYMGLVNLGAATTLTSGTIELAGVTGGGNNLTLNNSGAASGSGLITAGTLYLNGGGNVGASGAGNALNTAVSTLTDDKSGGNAFINQPGNEALNVNGTTTGGSQLNVTAGGNLAVGPLDMDGPGALSLISAGGINFNNSVIAASITSQSDSTGLGLAANSTTFSPGVTMQADNQSYQAGNGSSVGGALLLGCGQL